MGTGRTSRIDWGQLGILSERYLELIGSDLGSTLLLILQAPIIAVCVILVWGDYDEPTSSLYFVLALSAIWFGAINACREIVKERAIFERERRVGLEPAAYVLSKLTILSMLGFVQCLCLIFLVDVYVPLPGVTLWHFLVLFSASLAGTALGLALSAVVSTPDRAVAAVPILLLPQILFSEMVVSHEHSGNLIKTLENLTFTAWAHQGLKEVTAADPSLFTILKCMFVLLVMAALLTGAAVLLVRRR
ncbi:MAG: ABC transporter permease [Armatimonadetes bacterium]|nr:ABC transporter permease [Armatimonadota bacterium]